MKHLISTVSDGSEIPERERFHILADAGFDAVDYSFREYAGYVYSKTGKGDSVFNKPDAEVVDFFRRQAGLLRESGLKVAQAHAPFPSNFDEGTKTVVGDFNLRLMRLSVTAAGEMGCPYLIVHPAFNGGVKYTEDPDALSEVREINRRMYLALVPEAKAAGVRICLENMWQRETTTGRIIPGVCSTAGEFAGWIDDLNAEAGEDIFFACLDTGHALLVGEDPAKMIEALGNRLAAFHMHDVIADNDLHTVPFEGMCDWPALAAAIKKSGYVGILNFETTFFIGRRPPELYAPAVEFLAKTAEWFRGLIDGEH